MSNEELAIPAQQGDKRALFDLWHNVQKLMYLLCSKKYSSLSQNYIFSKGITLDDMKQESYFAFLQAVKAYKTDGEYKFTSYINFYLKNSFRRIFSQGNYKQDSLSESISLNIPIGEDKNIELLDTLEDSTIQETFDSVIDKEYTKELHQALDKAMKWQCSSKECDIINMRYYQNKTQKEVSQFLGVSDSCIGQLEQNAYKKLRTGKAIKILETYRLETLAYSLSGSHGTWKDKGSIQERTSEKLEELRAKFKLENVV